MVRIFKTIEGAIHEIQEPQEDCWIAMTNPTATEIFEMSERFGIEVDDLWMRKSVLVLKWKIIIH